MSNRETRVYKPLKSVTIGGVIVLVLVFFGLTLPLLISEETIGFGKIFGLMVFWLFGIVFSLSPFLLKLEIGNDYVKVWFFGLCLRELHTTNISVLEYGNLMKGGLGIGKGLKGWESVNGKSKYFSFGENFWGKETIRHIKRALEPEE